MILLICGCRHWTDETAIAREIDAHLDEIDTIVAGGAPGADKIAARIARNRGISVKEYFAKWSKYGRAAGPIRNQEMLDKEHIDVVWAFHPDIKNSKGTRDMIRRTKKANIKFVIHTK